MFPYSVYSPLQFFNSSTVICPILSPVETEQTKNLAESPQTPSSVHGQTFSQAVVSQNGSFKARALLKQKNEKTQYMDQEYRPDCSQSRRKLKMKQIDNRNIIPNVIRLIISFIQKKGKSEIILEKLFRKLSPSSDEWSIRRFYHYQSMLRNSLSNYVNEETLRLLVCVHVEVLDIYGEEQQRFYNRLSRILINEFFRHDYVGYVLTSKRMDKNKRQHHLIALRNIKNRIRLLLDQEPKNSK